MKIMLEDLEISTSPNSSLMMISNRMDIIAEELSSESYSTMVSPVVFIFFQGHLPSLIKAFLL